MATTQKNSVRKNTKTKTARTKPAARKSASNNNIDRATQSTNNAFGNAANIFGQNSFGQNSAYTNPFAFGNTNPADYLNNMMPNSFMQGFNGGNAEQWMATLQKNLETSIAAGQQVMSSFKQVAEKQAAFFSSLMQDNTSALQDMLTSNADSKRKLADTSEALKDNMERLANNTRETMQYMEKTATDVSKMLNKRMSDCLDEIKDAA